MKCREVEVILEKIKTHKKQPIQWKVELEKNTPTGEENNREMCLFWRRLHLGVQETLPWRRITPACSPVLLTQAHTLTSSDHTWVVSQGAGRIKNSFQNYAIQNIPTVKGLMKAYKSHEEENHHDWKSEKTAKCGTKQFQVIKTINKQHF